MFAALAAVGRFFGIVKATPASAEVVSSGKDEKGSDAVVVAEADIVEAQVVNDPKKWVDVDQFYSKYNVTILPAKSAADKKLAARAEKKSDRFLDLLLVMDCTSSMSSWIELCKTTLKDTIDEIKQQHKELEVRVAFVGYRDFGDGDQMFVIQDFSLDLPAVKKVISSTRAIGGADIPEDIQGGLYFGLRLDWRQISVKVCYLCTDAPCHGKQYHTTTDDYPKGNPAGLMMEDLAKEYSDKGIDLTVYELTSFTDKMYEIIEQAYNQGSNKGEMKRITLKKQMDLARKR